MTALGEQLRRRVEAWMAADPDVSTRAELRALLAAGDTAGIEERFAEPLRFGTAGLRAPLGAGPARMNRLVVRRTTAGLARWLLERDATGGLVVGRDARHGSDAFAADTVEVAAALGVAVHPLGRPLPTPVTAFAVRHLGAAAGVMVTASHNPAADNGYKVYVGDGAQIVPPDDAAVAGAAEAAPDVPVGAPPAAAVDEPIDDEVLAAYRAMALGLVDPGGPRALRIVYTPMHGVGAAVVPGLLESAGFDPPVLVARQADPDPGFPTVAFPNPEEPGALDLALATAREAGADLVIANDPDADRLAVAVPGGDGWRVLTGDELGILLGDHRIATTSGPDRVVATTIVSSSMLGKLARATGVGYRETLTGFKWVARAAPHLVLGYEEALGYAVTDAVADKDGITAALVVAEMAARVRAEGRSLLDRLDDLAALLGVHLTRQWTQRGDPGELVRVVDAWRRDPPTRLAGLAVTQFVDLAHGAGGLPATDAVLVRLGDAGRVVLRPSGTEPKLKVYLEVATAPPGADGLEAARREAAERLSELLADVRSRSGG